MAGHYPLIENDRPELVISGDQPLCPLLAKSGHEVNGDQYVLTAEERGRISPAP